MSRTQPASQETARTTRISGDHDLASPDREHEIDATDDGARRWYHLRPKPACRTDLWGFNSTWWMVLGWPLLVVFAISPWPWW